MEDKTVKALVAMACITVLEAIAMYLGVNGTLLAGVVAALAGLGGYAIGKMAKD